MNNSMSPSMAHECPHGRRQPLANESTLSRVPPEWAILTAIADLRQKRAAHALLRAERDVRRTCARQEEAEAEAARLNHRAEAIEREWHHKQPEHETLGLDLHRARAARIQRQLLADSQAEHVRMRTQDNTHASRTLEQARERHGKLARKSETWRALRQHLEVGGVE